MGTREQKPIGMGIGFAVGALVLIPHLCHVMAIDINSSGLPRPQSSNDDEVTYLPGWNGRLPSRHYAGEHRLHTPFTMLSALRKKCSFFH